MVIFEPKGRPTHRRRLVLCQRGPGSIISCWISSVFLQCDAGTRLTIRPFVRALIQQKFLGLLRTRTCVVCACGGALCACLESYVDTSLLRHSRPRSRRPSLGNSFMACIHVGRAVCFVFHGRLFHFTYGRKLLIVMYVRRV